MIKVCYIERIGIARIHYQCIDVVASINRRADCIAPTHAVVNAFEQTVLGEVASAFEVDARVENVRGGMVYRQGHHWSAGQAGITPVSTTIRALENAAAPSI